MHKLKSPVRLRARFTGKGPELSKITGKLTEEMLAAYYEKNPDKLVLLLVGKEPKKETNREKFSREVREAVNFLVKNNGR